MIYLVTGGSGSGKSAYAESLLSEQTVQIEQALKKFKDSDKMSYVALVECVSNLTANEMFDENGQRSEDEVVRRVVSGLKVLSQSVRELVIVTNNVFDDGITYDESTMAYIRALARINIELAAWADEVTEVVAGCPVIWKK